MRRRAVAQLVVSAACGLALLLVLDPRRLVESLSTADAGLLGLATCLTPVILLLRAWRWHVLARSEVADLRFGESWHSYMGGLVLGVVTPLAAGELGRAAFLRAGRAGRLAALVVVDKTLDLALVGALSLAGVAWVFPEIRFASLLAPLPVVAWTGIVLCASWLSADQIRRFPAALQVALLDRGRLEGRRLLMLGVLGVGALFTFYSQAWLVLKAVAPGASPRAVALWPTVTLSTVVPALLGGLGVRELTAASLLPAVGVESAAAVNAAFLQFVIVMAGPALLAAPRLGASMRHRARA